MNNYKLLELGFIKKQDCKKWRPTLKLSIINSSNQFIGQIL